MSWRGGYNLFAVPAMEAGLLLAMPFSRKVRAGVRGRLHEAAELSRARSRCRDDRPRVLVHCASAGELEGAVPLLEALRGRAEADIILSYYSPSARERAEGITAAAAHLYLPFDSPRRVRRLLDILEPSLILFAKHDLWPNLIWEAADRGIPTAVINGNFRPDSTRLRRWAIPFNREVLGRLSAIYAVAEDDARRFRFLAGGEVQVVSAGDTRFDRVRQRALAGREVAVAGSTWPEDEKRLLPAWGRICAAYPGAVLVLVPHEPTPERLRGIEQGCAEEGIRTATLAAVEEGADVPNVVVVDRVGVLAGLYGLGRIAYVGGGFGAGVHSVLEPAVFAIPVLFGPRHLNSHEARDLLALGCAEMIETPEQVARAFDDALAGGEESRRRGELAGGYVARHTGVADRLAGELAKLAGW